MKLVIDIKSKDISALAEAIRRISEMISSFESMYVRTTQEDDC